jgi:hypothetical protein
MGNLLLKVNVCIENMEAIEFKNPKRAMDKLSSQQKNIIEITSDNNQQNFESIRNNNAEC